jgi:uncharacterized protein DUF1761
MITMPTVNYVAVLVSAIVIFLLGGLWYSPLLFAKPWMALQGKTREQLEAGGGAAPMMYVQVFLSGLATSFVMALIIGRLNSYEALTGVKLSILCWAGFAAPTSYGTALFSMKPRALWMIDTAFNLVSFVVAGIILAMWR